MNTYLSGLTRFELEDLKVQLNLTQEEDQIFNDLAKGKSNVEISLHNHISTSSVTNKIRIIRSKIERVDAYRGIKLQ